MKKLCAAAAALGLFALPSLASAETAKEREGVSVLVSTEGLDPATPEGLAKLRERTARAITAACKAGDRLKTSLSPDWRCRNELGFDAAVKIAAVSRNAKGSFASR
jgi:UrcA family protein